MIVSVVCLIRDDERFSAVLAALGILAIICTAIIWSGISADLVMGTGVKAGIAGLLTEIVAGAMLIAAAAYPFSGRLLHK